MFGRRIAFRTRSPDRDKQGDQGRRDAVVGMVNRMQAEIEREIAGLETRMQEAYVRANALLDESAEFGQRSAQDESEITAFEKTAETARQRVSTLRQEQALFARVAEMVQSQA